MSGYGFLEHFIPLASRLIGIKYAADTVKSEQDVFIYSLTWVDLTVYREWGHFDFYARLKKQTFSSETTEASQSCNKKQQLSFDKSRSIFNKILQQTNRSTS